ncbi:MAG: hypothetical protein MJH11_05860 [Lentisphaeria bacterium]|nr:hypothetical protein [Lentisphaeria bacterium]
MAFEFNESWDEHWERGYTIFKGIVPGSLLTDLRIEADKARALAHEINGSQSHRIQPIDKYDQQINQKPFQDYCELPELHTAVEKLLGPDYTHGHRNIMGILVEPLDHTWNQGWHRDGMVEIPVAAQSDPEVIACQKERTQDRRGYNQINCAIYRDATLWVVPGSHSRMENLEGEIQTCYTDALPTIKDGQSDVEFERECLAHCQSFPGAQQIVLEPGDFMIYRSNAWHCAHIVKYQPRATIHDSCHYHGKTDWQYHWPDVKKRVKAEYK